MKAFGLRLRDERARLHFTQEQLAQLCGVQANAQGRYESGAREPRADYMAALMRNGVDTLYVLTGLRPPKPDNWLTEVESSLLSKYRELLEEDQSAVEYLITALAALRHTTSLRMSQRPEYNFELMAIKVLSGQRIQPPAIRRQSN